MDGIIIKGQSKEVEECQVLGGIDTLYCFLDCVGLASKELYQNLWDSVNKGSFQRENYHFLGFSGKKNGFIGGWYSYVGREGIPLFKVGFKDPLKQQQVKNIFIQFYASGIYSLGFHGLLNFVKAEFTHLLSFDVTNDDLILSRVDLNAFIDGYDFSKITADMFRHSFKFTESVQKECLDMSDDFQDSFSYSSRRGIQTLYLGNHHVSPLYMKIYDKNAELNKKEADISSMVKRYHLQTNGFNSDHVWNLEYTMKKEVLNQYGAFTVTHLLLLADSIFKDLMQRNSFLGYDLENIDFHRKNKHISRLSPHPIWQKILDNYRFCNYDIDVQRVYKEYKQGSRDWACKNIISTIRKQKNIDNNFTEKEILALYHEAQKDIA